METIDRRPDGGRHRQGSGDAPELSAIPTPRRDECPTDQMSRVQRSAMRDQTGGIDAGYRPGALADLGLGVDDGFFDDELDADYTDDFDDAADFDDADADQRDVEGADDMAENRTTAIPAREPAVQPVVPTRRAARRKPVAGWTVRRTLWTIGLIFALGAIVLAAVTVFPGLALTTATAPEAVPQPAIAQPALVPADFGEQVERADGWTVRISQPTAVKPADAPDDAARAVRFDVTLTNTAAEARDSAGWTVKALVGATPVELSPAGGGAPSRTIRPAASLTFPVTVPLSTGDAELQLEAAPTQGNPSLFVGTA